MKDRSPERIKSLLFTDEPMEDENLHCYILRLAEMKEITDVRWIYKTVCDKKIYEYDYSDNFYAKINFQRILKLAGVDFENVKKFYFKFPEDSGNLSYAKIDLFDQAKWSDFIKRASPKICPVCLAEQNYCREIWELSIVTTCPHHNCELIYYCQNCESVLRWSRPALNVCRCGFDFGNLSLRPQTKRRRNCPPIFTNNLDFPAVMKK